MAVRRQLRVIGAIASVDSVQAADDGEALRKAAAQIETSLMYPAVEVWHEKRLVGRVP